jgi:hypothetical protein
LRKRPVLHRRVADVSALRGCPLSLCSGRGGRGRFRLPRQPASGRSSCRGRLAPLQLPLDHEQGVLVAAPDSGQLLQQLRNTGELNVDEPPRGPPMVAIGQSPALPVMCFRSSKELMPAASNDGIKTRICMLILFSVYPPVWASLNRSRIEFLPTPRKVRLPMHRGHASSGATCCQQRC